MPNTNIQTGQDWGAVNVGRSSAGRVAVPKTAHGVTRAKAMGLLATVVGEYESGKAVPNGQIIVKMERVL
eukprot:scaffold19049_cov89-Skeletonema_dohrnii-CCMP3373.AAC.1